MNFTTHTREVITGARLVEACKEVANDCRELALLIRKEDEYASHVSDAEKEEYLRKSLALADLIEAGHIKSFTIWQRVNEKLTGVCVAFLK